MKRFKFLLLTAMLAGSLYSCGLSELQIDELEIDEIPTAAPLGHLTFDNVTDFILVKYFQSTVPAVEVPARTTPPSQEPMEVPIPTYQTDVELNLETVPDFVLEEAIVESGNMSLELNYNLPSNTNLLLELPYILDATGQPFKRIIFLAKNQDYSITPHVVNLDLQGFRVLPVDRKIRVITGGSITVEPNDENQDIVIEPTLKLTNLEFTSIKGYFGKKEFSLGAQTLSLENQLSGAVSIGTSGSVLKIAVENTVGVPFELDLSKVKAVNKSNSSINLDYTGNTVIQSGTISGSNITPTKTYFELNSRNSNISQFISADTKEILFDIDVTSNPGSGAPVLNFVTNESSIKVSIGVLVPIKITPGS